MEETPIMQIKINDLTAELLKTKTVLDQTRELLKSAEQESRTLKATLEGVLNNKQEGPVRKIMSDIVEVISNMKFQSPIVRKGS
jgi:phenylalanyl-tRNA synthetase alpha subunit